MQKANRYLNLIYGEDVLKKVMLSNILVVGAGGIGCELIKNLCKSGFRQFTLIDLDTIEFTNLNRQFYFRREHVGKSKAEVARDSILKIDPDLKVTAFKDNLYSEKFDHEFFQSFDLVFNALDNQDARNYLSQRVIENRLFMVEAGTGGYDGQTYAVQRFTSQCDQCNPPAQRQSFAICTIRSDPTENIHCIVWAKNFFNVIFGNPGPENVLKDNKYVQFVSRMFSKPPE